MENILCDKSVSLNSLKETAFYKMANLCDKSQSLNVEKKYLHFIKWRTSCAIKSLSLNVEKQSVFYKMENLLCDKSVSLNSLKKSTTKNCIFYNGEHLRQ